MGFPSPATDYVESVLTVSSLCGINNNSVVIETDTGYAVIEKGMRARQGDMLLATFDGRSHFVKWAGESLITEDGEAIEGEALDEVIVHGVVTFTINGVIRDDGACMGKKISAKQLKTAEGSGSSCANALLFTYFLFTSAQYHFILPPILNKPEWAD